MHVNLPHFLPGRLLLSSGSPGDYTALARFHYLARRPATWAAVWTIHFMPDSASSGGEVGCRRLVAVGVLSYPVPCCRGRERFLNLSRLRFGDKLRFANANIRTISRVIVHPQFRALGLSTALIRCLCDNCPTRYVEAMAMMARAHPLFERAGMTRVDPPDDRQPVYFIFDRFAPST